MPHQCTKIGKGRINMMYFITFLAGMGFAALLDLTIQAIQRHRMVPLALDIETGVTEVFAIDPTTTKVGNDQLARLREQMGL